MVNGAWLVVQTVERLTVQVWRRPRFRPLLEAGHLVLQGVEVPLQAIFR